MTAIVGIFKGIMSNISGFVNEDNLGRNMINCLSIVHCARIPFTMTSKPNLQSVAGFFPPRIIR